MPYIGRAPTSTATKLEDADQDTKIQVEESSDEDIIRFDIAGAEDFTMSANSFNVLAGSKIDLNGTELILDADADTSITADTDDQIDIRIAGADDFQFTANTLSVLSGSTLNIDSGATIANSGTATGFGPSVAAAAGIMEANANFVDAVIFGPAMDPVDWSGRTAAPTASLMLATLEETDSSSQLNIWDLTSTTIASATPLYTVTVGVIGTSLAASMGYVALAASNSGVRFYDPHDGAWAERTVGWPYKLQSDTSPALTNNDVQRVTAGFSDQPAHDPRTGGPMPTFALVYGTGVDETALLKDDGYLYNYVGTVGMKAIGISNGYVILSKNTQGDGLFVSNRPISGLNNDDYGGTNLLHNDAFPYALGIENGMDVSGSLLAGADPHGLSFAQIKFGNTTTSATSAITRAYNTGYMVGDIRGAWLANSKTVDRSYKANTLTENGTVPTAAVASGADLTAYGPYTTSNWFGRANDADFAPLTGDISVHGWFKATADTATQVLFRYGVNATNTNSWLVQINAAGTLRFMLRDSAANNAEVDTAAVLSDSVWHHFVGTVDRVADILSVYIDGVVVGTASTSDLVSMTSVSGQLLSVGSLDDGASPAIETSLALMRMSKTAITATQVRQAYDAEKGMFVANAKCLLQSGSTDAVLDVSVDPITNKVAVTQTDSQMIWNGLVMESAPAVNAGASEHNKLYGGDRVEINSVNLYATIAAKNLRGDLELVRGMKAGLPAGVDLSKAKAWLKMNGTGTVSISASYNIKSISDNGTGNYEVVFSTPFKSGDYVMVGSTIELGIVTVNAEGTNLPGQVRIKTYTASSGAALDAEPIMVAFFGELENE